MKLLILFLSIAAIHCSKTTFEGHQVFRVESSSDEVFDLLRTFQEEIGLDFWTEPSKQAPTDFRVQPALIRYVKSKLSKVGVTPFIMIEDLQKTINEEEGGPAPSFNATTMSGRSLRGCYDGVRDILDNYYQYDDIVAWMRAKATANSDIASVQSIGKTFEGRDTFMIKIGKNTGSVKKVIWVDSGIHAREWIAISTGVYLINEIINRYRDDANIKALVDTFDIYILPVANPDGYVFTFNGNRMWRKTRRPVQGSTCKGADPNRNFDQDFARAGASRFVCDDTYPGEFAFSEVETQNIRDQVLKMEKEMFYFNTIHCYSQLWLLPFGYGPRPADHSRLKQVAQIGAAAFRKVDGKSLTIGSVQEILYPASGGSFDWVKGKTSVKYTFAMELRPTRFHVGNGFILNKRNILPSGREMYAGLIASIDAVKGEYSNL